MAIEKCSDGTIIYTGDDLYKAIMGGFNKRDNYEKSCDFCVHNGSDDDYCSGCSIQDEDRCCSCHINPPCSYCVDSKFEPTTYIINYKNRKDGKTRWECFPTTKKVFKKFRLMESKAFELSAEILPTTIIAIYLNRAYDKLDDFEEIELCTRREFKKTATKMIVDFKISIYLTKQEG